MIELANPTPNPWGLNERQVEVLDALVRTGSNLEAASDLGLNKTSIAEHVLRCCRKVGADACLWMPPTARASGRWWDRQRLTPSLRAPQRCSTMPPRLRAGPHPASAAAFA